MKLIDTIIPVLAIVAAPVLTSCGEDEPDTPAKDNYQSVSVGYYLDLSEDYYYFYDVNVIYTDGNGELMRGPLSKNQDFGYTIPVAKLPANIRFALELTAKTPLPPIEINRTYTFSNKSSIAIVGNKADGTKEPRNIDTRYFEFEVSSDNVAAFIAEEPEMIIGPYEYSTTEFKK